MRKKYLYVSQLRNTDKPKGQRDEEKQGEMFSFLGSFVQQKLSFIPGKADK